MDKLTCLISSLVSFLISFTFTYEVKADNVCIIEENSPVQVGEPWYIWVDHVPNPYWEPQVLPQPNILWIEDEKNLQAICLEQEQSNIPNDTSEKNIFSETSQKNITEK